MSIASACSDRVAELTDQGFDESVVRQVTSTVYTGESPFDCVTLEAYALQLRRTP